jgi:uncharacterized protein YwgA
MNTYDFVHLALHALGGEIKGKTKLQKTIYFLGVMTGRVKELGFHAHFYGPYSEEVACAIDRLKALGFIDQTLASGGAVDDRGFEVARFDFRLNDSGRRVAESKLSAYDEEWKKLVGACSVLKRVGDQDYMKLSIAAKTYFMLGERKGEATMKELADLSKKFGWSVSAEQALEAARLLETLKLVKLKS